MSTLDIALCSAASAAEREARADVARWDAEHLAAVAQADAARAELASADLVDLDAAQAVSDRVRSAERRAATATALASAARRRLEVAQEATALDVAQQLRAIADAAWSTHLQHAQRTADLLALLADHEGHEFAPAGRWPDPTTSARLRDAAKVAETEAADAAVPLLGGYAAIRPGPVTGRERDVVLVASGPVRLLGEEGAPVTYELLVDGQRHERVPRLQSSPLERLQMCRLIVPVTAVVTLTADLAAGTVADTFDPGDLADES